MAGIGTFQFAQAQTAELTNMAPCQVTFDLTWDASPCSGNQIVTSHLLTPGSIVTITAPSPGALVVQYQVTYAGSPVPTIIQSRFCNGGPGGGVTPSSGCNGTGGMVNWDDNTGFIPHQISAQ